MTPDELLKLLDLPGADAAGPSPGSSIIGPPGTSDPTPAALGPTALDMDEWGLRRGRDLAAESDRLRKLDLGEHAVADFFAAAFDPDPRLLPGCTDPRRHQFLAQLLDTSDYRELHAATRLDDTAAAIAAGHFGEQFAALKKDEDEKERKETGGGVGGTAGGGDEIGREVATLRAVGKALAEARDEVAELKDAAAAFGLGAGGAGAADPKAVAAVFRRVRHDPGLRRICELAGRFRRVAQSRQRRKVVHGLDDVAGVEPGGDPGRLLPHELAKLVVPDLEWDTLRRLAERQLLCREHHASEPVGKGPVIVTVDESGSMDGEKVHTAKALALALAWVARQQRRWCGLVAYSGESGERLLALPPGRWDEGKLADWLAAFIGGGSDLDVPLRELPGMYQALRAPAGVTDVVMVTDAVCRVPAGVKDTFNAWKAAAKARVIGLVVGAEGGQLAGVCDEVHTVPALSADAEAVGRVLSI